MRMVFVGEWVGLKLVGMDETGGLEGAFIPLCTTLWPAGPRVPCAQARAIESRVQPPNVDLAHRLRQGPQNSNPTQPNPTQPKPNRESAAG